MHTVLRFGRLLGIWSVIGFGLPARAAEQPEFDAAPTPKYQFPAQFPSAAAVYFVVTTKAGTGQFRAVTAKFIYGGDRESRALPPEAVQVDENAERAAPGIWRVRFTPLVASFRLAGEYGLNFELRGTSEAGTERQLNVTVTLNVLAADINQAQLGGHVYRATRWGFFQGGHGVIRQRISESTGKSDVIELHAETGGELMDVSKGETATEPKVASGRVQITLAPTSIVAGRSEEIELALRELWTTGTLAGDYTLSSPRFAAAKAIPFKVIVSDFWLFPLIVIVLGVYGGARLNRIARADRPRQLIQYELTLIVGDLRRLEAQVSNTAKVGRLGAIEAMTKDAEAKVLRGDFSGAETIVTQAKAEIAAMQMEERAQQEKMRGDLAAFAGQLERYRRALDPAADGAAIATLDQAKASLPRLRENVDGGFVDQAEHGLAQWRAEVATAMLGRLTTRAAAYRAALSGIPALSEKATFATALGILDMALAAGKFDEAWEAWMKAEVEWQALQGALSGRGGRANLVAPQAAGPNPPKLVGRGDVRDWTSDDPVMLAVEGDVAGVTDFEWNFGERTPVRTDVPFVQHRFREPGDQSITVTLIRAGGSTKLPALPVTIRIGSTQAARSVIEAQVKRGDDVLFYSAVLLASISGMIYFLGDKPFGSLADYALAFLWGFGVDQTVRGFSGVLQKLNSP